MMIKNRLLTFNGGHQWPPEETAMEAIRWLEIVSVRNGAKHKNGLRSYFEDRLKEARDLKNKGALGKGATG